MKPFLAQVDRPNGPKVIVVDAVPAATPPPGTIMPGPYVHLVAVRFSDGQIVILAPADVTVMPDSMQALTEQCLK